MRIEHPHVDLLGAANEFYRCAHRNFAYELGEKLSDPILEISPVRRFAVENRHIAPLLDPEHTPNRPGAAARLVARGKTPNRSRSTEFELLLSMLGTARSPK